MRADDTLKPRAAQIVQVRSYASATRFRASRLALRPRFGCDRPMELEIWQWGLLGVAVLLIVVFVVMKTKKK